MHWVKGYEIGIPLIDTQHKQLFRFNDELQDSIKRGLRVAAINALLTQLKQYAARHFAMEEKFMADVEYPQLEEQQEAHKAFVFRFEEIQKEFNEKGLTPPLVNSISNELSGWINDHITGMDQEFGRYYGENH